MTERKVVPINCGQNAVFPACPGRYSCSFFVLPELTESLRSQDPSLNDPKIVTLVIKNGNGIIISGCGNCTASTKPRES